MKDAKGKTPLMLAAEKNPDPAVIAVLLKAGANVKAADADGINALLYAVGQGGVTQSLASVSSALAGLSRLGGLSLSGRAIAAAGPSDKVPTGIPEKMLPLISASAPVNVQDSEWRDSSPVGPEESLQPRCDKGAPEGWGGY